MLMAGARHIFLPRFEPGEFLAAAQQHSVTSFIAVPAMVAALMDAAEQGTAGKGAPKKRLFSCSSLSRCCWCCWVCSA